MFVRYKIHIVRCTLFLCVGALPPTTTASVQSATSATISWTLQTFSLPVNRYTYSLSSQMLCDNVQDMRSPVTTNDLSVAFTDLQEFSNYRLTLTAVFDSFGTEVTAMAMEDFMTLTAGEYQRKQNNSFIRRCTEVCRLVEGLEKYCRV